jgi:NAD-dependent deacetylase
MNKSEIFNSIISSSLRITALTGAGISTSAGIPDFRGPNGLYSRKDIPAELIFDIDHFRHNPSLFYTHIGALWKSFVEAAPTVGHSFLAKLEKKGKLLGVITQNIDGLHEKAGSKTVIPIHGDFRSFYCITCGERTHELEKIFEETLQCRVPLCASCGGTMKPSVVFFGEQVLGMEKSVKLISSADTVLVIGSSLVVNPAAILPQYRKKSSKLLIINMGRTYLDDEADCVVDEGIDEFLNGNTC